MAVSTDGIMRYLTIGGATYEVYDTTYNEATNSVAGLMSVADKLKLDSITVSDIGTVGADSIRGEKNISVSITDGVATIGHSNTAVTSSNTQPSKNNSASSSTALSFGDIVQFPYVTYDAYGHVTQKNIVAFQLPAAPSSTDTATNATNATYATYDASEANKTTKTTIADKFILKSVGTTKGDIIYYSGTTPAPTRLAIGSEGQVLKVGSNGIPVWGTDSNDNSYHTSGSWSGVTYTATANGGAGELKFTLPTASASASGIINTDAQSFKGDKTFQSNTFRIRNANNDNNQAGSNPWITQLNLGDGNYVTVTEYKDDHMALRGSSILLNTASAFGVYDATKTYSVGNIVWYEKAYYRCTTAITTAEAWTAEHWTVMPTSGIMANADLNPWITSTYNLGTSSYKWNNIYTNSINGTIVPSISQQTTQAVYPIKINAIGQITGYGSAVTIPTIPSNNVTGSGTSGYLVKWNGANSITNGPQLGSSTTTYLRNDGSWATPTDTNTTYSLSGALSSHKFTSTLTATNPSGTSTSDFTLAAGTGITLTDNTSTRTITIASSVTNTDTLVTQTNTIEDAEYRLLFSANANDSNETTTARKSTYLRYNPDMKVLVNAGEVRAEKGVFDKLVATTLNASSATIEDLSATNATIVGLLDVQGQMQTNSWTNSNIATIDGSFYICPTISSEATVTTSGTTQTSDNKFVYNSSGGTIILTGGWTTTGSLYLNDTAANWSLYSKVMITGEVLIGKEWTPIGTIRGVLQGINTSNRTITIGSLSSNITVGADGTINSLPAILSLVTSGTTYNARKLKISLYEYNSTGSSSAATNLIGIMMTTSGTHGFTYLDIYNGLNSKTSYTSTIDNTTKATEPMVRIGNLNGLPNIVANGTADTQPRGWGIYTTNGYFKGNVVANAGRIGSGTNAWTIGNDANTGKAMIYTGTRGQADSAYVSTGIGTENIGGSGVLNATNDGYWAFTAGTGFGVTTKGKLYANDAHIIGSIEATSFIARGANNTTIATFNSEGIVFDSSAPFTFGSQNANISFNPANGGSINITGEKVVFAADVVQQITKDINVGARNLIPDTQRMDSWLPASGERVTKIEGSDYNYIQFVGSTADWNCCINSRRTLNPAILDGTDMILSFEYRSTGNWQVNNIVCAGTAADIGEEESAARTKYRTLLPTPYTTLSATSEWKKVSFKTSALTIDDLTSGSGDVNSWYLQIFVHIDNLTVDVRKIKLEKGNIATDWSPAPEDLAEVVSLETVSSELGQAQQELSDASKTIVSQGNSIEKLQAATDSNAQAIDSQKSSISTLSNEQTNINNRIDQTNLTIDTVSDRTLVLENAVVVDSTEPSVTVLSNSGAVKITSTRVTIRSGGNSVAFAESNNEYSAFVATRGVFQEIRPRTISVNNSIVTLTGNLAFIARADGHVSLKKVKN